MVAVIDHIRAVAKERLERPIGEFVVEDLEAVEDGLRQILGLGGRSAPISVRWPRGAAPKRGPDAGSAWH